MNSGDDNESNRNTNRELTSDCAQRGNASIFGESPLKRAMLITREYGMLTRDEYTERKEDKKRERERKEMVIEKKTRWRRTRVGHVGEEEEEEGEGRAGGETVIIDDDWQRGHRRRWV